MHVALLSPAWPPGQHPNGIVTYVQWMREELLAQGHQVSVFAVVLESGPVDGFAYAVRMTLIDRMAGAMRSLATARSTSVFDFGKTIASSIRHVHEHDPIDVIEMEESFGWAAEVAKRTQVPVVCKLHGPAFLHMVEEELRTPFGKEKVRREGQSLAKLQVVISPSRCHLSDTLARYELNPAIAQHVVNPVKLSAEAAIWDIDKCDHNTLLFVGRFDKIKGGDLVVRAFQLLLAQRPGLRLIFVGPDRGLLLASGETVHFEQFVKSLNDPNLSHAISYRGQLGANDVAALRPTALLTIVASRRESQGYTALEAMLQACPVVCTDTSGLSEVVEHGVTGLKALPEDPNDLAEQIRLIVDNPALGRSLGLAGREYVLNNHGPSTVVAQTVDVYRRAVALYRAAKP